MPYCKCGCGKFVCYTWARGHHLIGTHRSEITKQKQSTAHKGDKNPNWGGKSCTEETSKKLSKALTGLQRTEKTKHLLSKSKTGNKNPNWGGKSCYTSTRSKMSKNWSGKNNPNWQGGGLIPCPICKTLFWQLPKQHRVTCSKKCMAVNQSNLLKGERGPNWRGGISSLPYSKEFNKWLKRQIGERDAYTCQNPNCRKNTNHHGVHHIDYNKENTSNLNLIYLCFSCNSRANYNRPFWQTFYTDIINERFTNEN